MSEKPAEEIISRNYEMTYDFHNNESSDSEITELLSGTYYAVSTDKAEKAPKHQPESSMKSMKILVSIWDWRGIRNLLA